MPEIKIMHMADVHFGRPVSGLDENLRNVRRQETRAAFCDALKIANERNVDVVLIAGDLFDSSETDKSTVNFIKAELKKIEHIPVLVSPGNHDPLGNAYRMLDDGSCSNLTVFTEKAAVKTFADKGFAVYGIGFDNEVVDQPLLKNLKAEKSSFVNIAVIHGELAADSVYNPVKESDIAQSDMDYVALGHVHTFSGIKKAGNTNYAYSGTLEGGGFDECGEKGVIIGIVSKEKCELEFLKICKRCYRTVEVDVTGAQTLQKIIDRVKAVTPDKNDLYKIVLTGVRSEKIPAGVIENEVEAFYVKTTDCTRGAYNIEEIAKDYTIGGLFAKKVLERMQNCSAEEKTDLLKAADVVFDILSE